MFKRYFVILSALAIIPLTLVMVYTYTLSRNILFEFAKGRIATDVSGTLKNIEDEIQSDEKAIQSFGKYNYTTTALYFDEPTGLDDILQDFLNTYTGLDIIMVIGLDGKIFSSAIGELFKNNYGTNVESRELSVRRFIEDNRRISKTSLEFTNDFKENFPGLFPYMAEKPKGILYMTPLHDDSSKTVGWLLAFKDVNHFEAQIVETSEDLKKEKIKSVDIGFFAKNKSVNEQELILSNNKNYKHVPYISKQWHYLKNSKHIINYALSTGREYFTGCSGNSQKNSLVGLDFSLCMSIEKKELYSHLYPIKKYNYFIISLSLLVSIALAGFLSKMIDKPIKYLVEQISNFKKGMSYNFNTLKKKRDSFQILADAFEELISYVDFAKKKEIEIEQANIIISLSKQVAHDIRSPLASLEVAVAMLQETVPEETRILARSALRRINDIANDLGGRKAASEEKNETGDLEVTLLSALIDSIVSEKRAEYWSRQKIEIMADLKESYGLFAKVGVAGLKRAISNLVNNSVQAFAEGFQGQVVVSLMEEGHEIKITTSDNGKGIPAEIIAKLGIEGNTFGKVDGKGLGLFITRTSVELWGGSFKVKSEVGKGTTVILTLPRLGPPDWFVSELNINAKTCVVVVDDDDSIHLVWETRLGQLQTRPQSIEHFRTAGAVLQKFSEIKEKHENILFLCDYELLDGPKNGLDLIEMLAIKDAILVTSHYEEKKIRERCEKLKVKLLPKGLAGFVPLKILKEQNFREAKYVLVDDAEANHINWKISAELTNKNLITFFTIEDFFQHIDEISKEAKIYIDSNLGNGVKGEEAAKGIHEKGFKRIFLCTGYSPEDFPPMPWIEAIVGKEPPFLKEEKEEKGLNEKQF